MRIIPYDRTSALTYALTWALKRNPEYYDFSKIGGDCTNFASQCLFAGSKTMNYTPINGWFYINAYNRTASWTGVRYFYNFLSNNKDIGPFARTVNFDEIELGDFIQLKNLGNEYHHTLIVVGFENNIPLIAAHSADIINKPISQYKYDELRCIHIEGIRII